VVRACRAGWPSCSHRPASIDLSTAHSIACVAFASTRQTLVVALRGSAPRGASRDGPPAPRRLGQPSPCTSPISDVLRRRRGHCLTGSRTGGKLARRASCDACRVFTRVTETPTTPRLAARDIENRDAFRRVAIDRVAPAAESTSAFWFECAAQLRAPFSSRSRRVVCQHDGAESSSTSAVSPTCLAAPRASRRAMRQTDFCLLTFFVRAPAPRRFPVCHALARRTPGVIACLTSVRFASVGHTFVVLSPRWAFSSRRDACDPYLWHPCRLSHSCHVARATCAPVEAAETALSPIA